MPTMTSGSLLTSLGSDTGQFAQVGGVAEAEQVAHPVEHDAGGDDAEQEILDGGFHVGTVHVRVAERDDHINGKGGDLQAHDYGQQFIGAAEQDQTEGADGQEQVVFRPQFRLHPPQSRPNAQHQEQAEGDYDLEQLGERVHPVGVEKQGPLLAEGRHGCSC